MVDPSHLIVSCLLNYTHFQSCTTHTLPKMYCDGYPLKQSPHYYRLTTNLQTSALLLMHRFGYAEHQLTLSFLTF